MDKKIHNIDGEKSLQEFSIKDCAICGRPIRNVDKTTYYTFNRIMDIDITDGILDKKNTLLLCNLCGLVAQIGFAKVQNEGLMKNKQ